MMRLIVIWLGHSTSWLLYSTDTDFSSLDISICQLSRRWQPSLGGCKKFEPSLRPGKSSYGWFIFRIGIVHVGKGRYWRKNDKKKFEKPPKLVLFSLQAFHVWSEEQLAATVFLRRTATALFLSVLSILWPSWSMQFRYICNVITRTKCFFKTLLLDALYLMIPYCISSAAAPAPTFSDSECQCQ